MSRAGTITFDLNSLITKREADLRKAKDEAAEVVAIATAEDRDFTKDEEAKIKDAQERCVSIQRNIDLLKKQLDIDARSTEPGKSKTEKETSVEARGQDGQESKADAEARLVTFRQWARYGQDGLNDEQREIFRRGAVSMANINHREARELSSVVGAQAGYTVPMGPMQEIDRAMKDYSGVLASAVTQLATAGGEPLPFPTVTDTSNKGERVGESQTVSTGGDPSFGQVMLGGYMYSSKIVLVPLQLLQDSAINVEQLLGDMLGERIGRVLNDDFTYGTGANQPQGIITGSTLGKTAAGQAAITYDELVDLQHSIDPAYRNRPGVGWQLHDTTVGLLRKLKDSQGRPIWLPNIQGSLQSGAPGTILDKPYWINQSMDTPAASKKTVLFGDHSKYKVRRIGNVALFRFAEKYMDKLQVGFLAFGRWDGRGVDAGGNPLKYLQQAA